MKNDFLKWALILIYIMKGSAVASQSKKTEMIPLFSEQDRLFEQKNETFQYPVITLFYLWSKKNFYQVPAEGADDELPLEGDASVLSARELVESLQLMEEEHDDFAFIYKMVLNYEIERKERMFKALESRNNKEYRRLTFLEGKDFIELILLNLDKKFQPSAHHNFALFLKHAESGELEKIFGGFQEILLKSGLVKVDNLDLDQQVINYKKSYMKRVLLDLQNIRKLKARVYEDWRNLKLLSKTLETGNFSKHLKFKIKGSLLPYLSKSAIVLAKEIPLNKAMNRVRYYADKHFAEDKEGEGEQIQEKTNSCPLKNKDSLKFQVEIKQMQNLQSHFMKVIQETLERVNKVAQSEDFLNEVKKKKYSGITSTKVLRYIQSANYKVNIGGRSMSSRVYASAGICADYIYFNSRLQYRHGADLAATIFHEITHNLGFLHGAKITYPLGDVMRKYYAKYYLEEGSEEETEFPMNHVLQGHFPKEASENL